MLTQGSGLSRRDFLQGTAAGVVLLGASEVLLTAPNAAAAAPPAPGYGPLVPDPAGRLALPAGFSYKIVIEAGKTLLESGEPTPGTHDGTGAFRSRRGTTLVNNHEIGPLPQAGGRATVPGCHGTRAGRAFRKFTISAVTADGAPNASLGPCNRSSTAWWKQRPWTNVAAVSTSRSARRAPPST